MIEGAVSAPVETIETIYRERGYHGWDYWTYSDGRRVSVGEAYVKRETARGRAKVIEVGA